MRTDFLPYLQRTWVGAAVGVGTLAVGIYSKGKANKKAKELQASRPTLSESPYLKDQISLAESQLSTGMSADAKAGYESDLDKSLSTSLSTVLKGGGSVNNISEIMAGDQQGRQRLSMMKDNLRLANIDRLTRAQDAEEQFRQEQFQVNQDAPWKDAAQGNALAKQAADNQIWSGVGMAASGAMKGIEGAKSTSDTSRYFNFASNPNNVSTASTGGGYSSPASQVQTINPNAYSNATINTSSPSLVDTLLENPNG
jgi:hypothetical protein